MSESPSDESNINELRRKWHTLYSRTLPALARSRDPAQTKWPVTLDHCFARIILDNIVGKGEKQWDTVIGKPAVRKMSFAQLESAIKLGEQIERGEADLVELDRISLRCRGKEEGKYKDNSKNGGEDENKTGGKRRADANEEQKLENSSSAAPPPQSKKLKTEQKDKVTPKRQTHIEFTKSESKESHRPSKEQRSLSSSSPSKTSSISTSDRDSNPSSSTTTSTNTDDIEKLIPILLQKIDAHPSLTPYRKRLYSTLLSVPRGKYTTYAAMSNYLNSSARAVGNGMRNNPFAPQVPCHRVLAADGRIGGFHGDWGQEGKYAKDKIDLLRGEGVYFDSKGKVKGPVFVDLKDLSRADTSGVTV